MFNRKPKPETTTGLEKTIDRLLSDLETMDPYEDKYGAAADNLTKLMKLREHDKPADKYRPSADTLAIAAANLLGVIIIVGYEQKHVIATKAMTFWHKLG